MGLRAQGQPWPSLMPQALCGAQGSGTTVAVTCVAGALGGSGLSDDRGHHSCCRRSVRLRAQGRPWLSPVLQAHCEAQGSGMTVAITCVAGALWGSGLRDDHGRHLCCRRSVRLKAQGRPWPSLMPQAICEAQSSGLYTATL